MSGTAWSHAARRGFALRPELFRHLITFDEALRRVLEAARPVDRTETVDLRSADGRVVARDIVAPDDVPAFDRSVMDGYAVRAADVAGASPGGPIVLECIEDVFTGEHARRPIEAGECVAIATGAPMPDGADSVVIVEQTWRSGTRVSVTHAVTPGQNVGRRGADMRAGTVILESGAELGPARIGSLAAIGLTHTAVYARPSVAILATGNEITPPGQPLPHGHVYDVNSFAVEAVARRHGAATLPLRAAADSLDELERALDTAAAHDVIVFSGGSSVGGRDLMLDAIRARGEVVFHGIAIKPGKPTLFGRVAETLVFGLPGNPTSCLMNAYLLLVPLLRQMARLPPLRISTVEAPLARSISSSIDRHQFYPVRLVDGRAEPAFKSSGDITSMAQADGIIDIPANAGVLEAGRLVSVRLL